MDEAAGNGHLHVVEFLQTHHAEGCTTRAMDLAAPRDHVEVVRFLHEHRDEGCTVDALDWKSQQGFLEMVRWLHANRNEGCRTDATDGAAASGHLEIVKFLHLNHREGYTTHAMDSAAGAGHLDMVKWLHENRSEGCTTDAMDYAAAAGHLDVRGNIKTTEFLHARRSEGVEIHDIILKYGASLHWLYKHYLDKCNLKAIKTYAEKFREWSILQQLEDIGVLRVSSERRFPSDDAALRDDEFIAFLSPDAPENSTRPAHKNHQALEKQRHHPNLDRAAPELHVVDALGLEIDAHIEHDADHDSDLRNNEKQHHDCREPDLNAPPVLCHRCDGVKRDDPVHSQQTRADTEAAVIPVQEIAHVQVGNGDLERQERVVEQE